MRRLIVPVLATALLLAVLVVGVFPTRRYLDQRAAIASADHDLAALTRTNDTLQAEADRLQTDQEIERQAREQYGYVRPGEEPYHVLPSPQDPVRAPDVWPFSRLQQRLDR
jgi:cell division protein FtsB